MEQKQKDALWAQYTKQTHRLGRVLWERANEAMTAFDYQRLMLCNELLRGNAYAWIYRDPRTGWPQELIPLPPDYVSIHVDDGGHVWYFFTHPTTGAVTMLRPEGEHIFNLAANCSKARNSA